MGRLERSRGRRLRGRGGWTSHPLLQRCEEGPPEGQPEAGDTTTRTVTAVLVVDSSAAAAVAVAAEMGEAVAVAVAAAGSTRAGEAGAARAPNSFRVH